MEYQLVVDRLKGIIREQFPEQSNWVELLAERLGMSPNTLYRKLNGKRFFPGRSWGGFVVFFLFHYGLWWMTGRGWKVIRLGLCRRMVYLYKTGL